MSFTYLHKIVFLLLIFTLNLKALSSNTITALNYSFEKLGVSRRELGFEKSWYRDIFRNFLQERCLADPVFSIEMSENLITNSALPANFISEIISIGCNKNISSNPISRLNFIRQDLFKKFEKYKNDKLYNYIIFKFSNIAEKRKEIDNLKNIGGNKKIIDEILNQTDNYLLPEENVNHLIYTEITNFYDDNFDYCCSNFFEILNLAKQVKNAAVPPEVKSQLLKKGIEIGTLGNDIFTNDNVWMIIDPGGDDLYKNSSGFASVFINQPLKIIIDFAGNDIYENKNSFGSGCGVFGISLIIDKKGDDVYRSGNLAQGCGIAGIGAVIDESGNDFFTAGEYSQGVGFFGIGALINNHGNDIYKVSAYGQAVGLTKGFGFLIDEKGNDTYLAGGAYHDTGRYNNQFITMSQGVGLGDRPFASGGIGILKDDGGNDVYVADVFGQGSAYWYGLGMLIDKTGNDSYNLYEYGQGAGIHMGCGILADGTGDDIYTLKGGIGQGAEHDFAVGLLRDFAGNDQYNGNVTVQGGAINNGVAFLIDDEGNDRYSSWSKIAHGDGEWAERRDFGSIAFLLDYAGKDIYGINETNNFTHTNGLIGICVDFSTNLQFRFSNNLTDSKNARTNFENCFSYNYNYKSPAIENTNFEKLYRMAIDNSSLKVKNMMSKLAKEKLKALGPKIIPQLVKKIEHPFNSNNYIIQEIITSWKTNAVAYLIDACNSTTNNKVKRTLIYFLGLIRDNRVQQVAINELNNKQNRAIALWALGNCGVTQSLKYAEQYIKNGENEMTKVRCAGIFRKLGTTNDIPLLMNVIETTEDWNIRCAAKEAVKKIKKRIGKKNIISCD